MSSDVNENSSVDSNDWIEYAPECEKVFKEFLDNWDTIVGDLAESTVENVDDWIDNAYGPGTAAKLSSSTKKLLAQKKKEINLSRKQQLNIWKNFADKVVKDGKIDKTLAKKLIADGRDAALNIRDKNIQISKLEKATFGNKVVQATPGIIKSIAKNLWPIVNLIQVGRMVAEASKPETDNQKVVKIGTSILASVGTSEVLTWIAFRITHGYWAWGASVAEGKEGVKSLLSPSRAFSLSL